MQSRTVYAIPKRPFINAKLDAEDEPDQGIYEVLYEETFNDSKREIVPITEVYEAENIKEIFISAGYSYIQRTEGIPLTKLLVEVNESKQPGDNQTHYYSWSRQKQPFKKNQVADFIPASLPDPGNPVARLPREPLTTYFFIVDGEYAYGPFLKDQEYQDNVATGLIYLDVPETNASSGRLKKATIHKYHMSELAAESTLRDQESYQISFDLPTIYSKHQSEEIDYLTPKVMQVIVRQILQQKNVKSSKQDALRFSAAIDNSRIVGLTSQIKTALQTYIMTTIQGTDLAGLKSSILDVIQSSEKGRVFIDEALAERKERYESEWKSRMLEEHDDITAKTKELERQREEALSNFTRLQRDIENKRQEYEEAISQAPNTEAIQEAIEKRRAEADKELLDIQTKVDELQAKYDQYKTAEELKEQINGLKIIEQDRRNDISELEESKKQVENQLEQSEISLRERLRNMLPYISALSHMPTSRELGSDFNELEPQNEIINLGGGSLDDYREKASNYIINIAGTLNGEFGREYSISAIASVLVATQQNFLTILTGPPGIGKTSFGMLLSKIQGLGGRFKNVSVGKGWLSEKDLIGFYNSLTDRFAPSATGIYQYLKGIQEDSAVNSSTHRILLDEANLSPIEQYWAPFLVMADSESDRNIPLSHETLKIPSSLRFIGTTNHDMTTEPLSARLIDRAPVIHMDVLTDNQTTDSSVNAVPVYSAKSLDLMFGKDSIFSVEISASEDDTITGVTEVMEDRAPEFGQPFIISPRKQQKIYSFVQVLKPLIRSVLGVDESTASALAIDYAVLYFVLPIISGAGQQTGDRLAKLRSVLTDNGLELSAERLDDIVKRADFALGSYNFFQY